VWRCKSTPLTMTNSHVCGGRRGFAVMSTWARHIRPRMNVPPRFTYNWWHFNLSQEHNNKTQPFMETWQTAYRLLCVLCFFAGPLISRRSALGPGGLLFSMLSDCVLATCITHVYVFTIIIKATVFSTKCVWKE